MERRLAAILAADVKGYSHLTELNEEASTATLRMYRAVAEESISAHRGHVFSSAGDGVVAEFPSLVEAIRCGVEIQNEIAERNASVPEDGRMQFRIGVNSGDVIAEDNNLYGTGVNVAVRLEQLAEPGGICISQTVYDQVRKIVEIPFEDIGERRLKNIAEPVHVYKVKLEGPKVRPRPRRSRKTPLGVLAASTIAILLVLVVGFGGWFYRDRWMPAPEGAAEHPVLGMPEGPAIAVLPFVNLSGDPQQEYFSDGLTEDLMTELSRASRDLRVLARNTTFQYKGKAVDIPKLGRELKVGYVLEGSVRRTDDRLRVMAQLIETQTGAHVWADRFDREMADVSLVQDEIVSQIVAKIAGNFGVIDINEARSATRKSPDEIQAYDLVLRAQAVMRPEWSHETFSTAKELLRQAIALDPLNARARRELAYLAVIGWVFRFDKTPEPPQEITAQAAKAVQLDPADARAHMVAASAYFFTKQLDLFEREAQQAIALAPYDGEILATVGHLIASSGQWQRGVALAKKANELNADAAAGWYHAAMYYDYYLQGDYERALEFRRLHLDQQAMHAYIEYIPVYGQLGRKQEAQENWRKLLADVPGASAETFEAWYHLWNMRDEDIAKLMDGVYKSGVLGVEAIPGH
jgi:adenylate cyclase